MKIPNFTPTVADMNAKAEKKGCIFLGSEPDKDELPDFEVKNEVFLYYKDPGGKSKFYYFTKPVNSVYANGPFERIRFDNMSYWDAELQAIIDRYNERMAIDEAAVKENLKITYGKERRL